MKARADGFEFPGISQTPVKGASEGLSQSMQHVRLRIEMFRTALIEGAVGALLMPSQLKAAATGTPARRALAPSAVLAGALLQSGSAYAASTCQDQGAGTLADWCNTVSLMLLVIGGAMFLLMVAIGALFIIFGGSSDRAVKGMEIVRQSVVGLAVLAGGGLLQAVVLAIGGKTPPSGSC